MNCAERFLSLSNSAEGRCVSLADIIFASTFKIYSTVSGRRFQSDLQAAKRRGFLSKMPSYNSVFHYLEAEALTPYLYELIKLTACHSNRSSVIAVDASGSAQVSLFAGLM